MKTAVIYARYSSDRQTEESIEAQVRACNAYAAAHNLHVTDVYADEAISGKGSATAKRTQYQKLLRDAEKHRFDLILIHKYDRIARNLGEHVNLEKRLTDWNVQLVAAAQDFGTSNEAKLVRTLMWALSEYYIDNLADEVKKGHRETAIKAEHNGGVAPFGYDVIEKKYVINPFEAIWVKKIFEAALHRKGFSALLAEMADCGVRGKRGKEIHYTQVYEILRNEKYTGTYIYSVTEEKNRSLRREKPNAIRIENAFPAIVDKAIFEEVQKIMDERKQTGRKGDYLCSGLVYCRCGNKMHVVGNGTHKYYSCSKHCGAPTVRMELVDKVATAYLDEVLSPKNQKIITQALKTYKLEEGQREKDFEKILKKKIEEKEKQYDALMQNMSGGTLPASVVADIGQKMQAIKTEIENLEKMEPPKEYKSEHIQTWLDALKTTKGKETIRLLIEKIEVKNNTEIKASSTLISVLAKHGCGGAQHSLPNLLFHYLYRISAETYPISVQSEVH